MPNIAPTLAGFAGSVTFVENAPAGLIDASVSFADIEGNLAGGSLTIQGLLVEDRIAIQNQGTLAGQIGVTGSDVTYGGTVIGSFTGGVGSTFSVTFNGAVTAAAIEALIEHLTYADVSESPAPNRILVLNVTDAAGADLMGTGRQSFTAQTGAANPFGAIELGRVSKPELVDIDGDGDLDLAVGNAYGGISAFRNDGGVFSQLTGTDNPFAGISGGTVTSIAFANFAGDARPDLLLGTTTGIFQAYRNDSGSFVELTGSSNPLAGLDIGSWADPVFIDVDGDGDQDVVAGTQGGTVYYLRNDGSTFVNAGAVLFGSLINTSPGAVDFDGDGDTDLVLGDFYGLRTYRNDGGTFTQVFDIPLRGFAGYRATPSFADLDGDGDLDAVIGDDQGKIAFLENAGQAITINVTPVNDAPVAGDDILGAVEDRPVTFTASQLVGNDSDVDGGALVVQSVVAGTGGTPVRNSDGTVTFTSDPDFNGTATFTYVVSDGAGGTDQGAVTVTVAAVNDAPRLSGFNAAVTYDENAVNAAPALLDTDVTITDPEGNLAGGSLTVQGLLVEDRIAIQNQGTLAGQIGVTGSDVTYGGTVIGSFTGGVGSTFSVTFNGAVTAAAIEALIEHLTYADVSETPAPNRILVLNVTDAAGADLMGTGRQSFTAQTGAANPFGAIELGRVSKPELVDIDGDGDLDLAVGNAYGGISAFRNDGGVFSQLTGTDNPFAGISGGTVTSIAFANFAGDARPDLLLGTTTGIFQAYRNDSGSFVELTGSSNPLAGLDIGSWADPVFIDVDGDGDQDVVAGTQGGTVYYLRNDGSTFVNAGAVLFGSLINTSPGAVDFDGDGDTDLVLGDFYGLRTYRNDGGTFTQVFDIPLRGFAGYRATPSFADLDGDGDLDAVIGDDQGRIAYLENAGQAITINVTPVNDIPTVNHNSGLTLNEGATGTLTSALLDYNDDQAESAITYTITSVPTNGILRLAGVTVGLGATFTQQNLNDGLVTYVHNGSETLGDQFGFSVSDGVGGSVSGQSFAFTINPVNEAPLNAFPTTAGGVEDSANPFTAVALDPPPAWISDPDSAVVSSRLTVVDGMLAATALSGATVTGSGSNDLTISGSPTAVSATLQTLSYTPIQDFFGTRLVTVTTSDGALSDTDVISWAIANVADLPTSADASVPATEDVAKVLDLSMFAFSDVDNDSFAGLILASVPAHGQLLNLLGDGGVIVDGSPPPTPTVLHVGDSITVAQITAGTIAYVPTPNYNGPDSFQFAVVDSGPAGQNQDAVPNTLSFTVAPVNDAPVANATGTSHSFTEGDAPKPFVDAVAISDVENGRFPGGTLSISASDGQPDDGIVILASLGLDVAGNAIEYNGRLIANITGPGQLTLTNNADADAVSVLIRSLAYANASEDPTGGTRHVTITFTDGGGTANGGHDSATINATLTVVPVNDPPAWSQIGSDSSFATLAETNSALVRTGTLTVNDLELADTVVVSLDSVSSASLAPNGVANFATPLSAMLLLPSGPIAANPGDQSNVAWTFNTAGETFNYLARNQAITISYVLKATDGSGATALSEVDIIVTGTNDAPFVTGAAGTAISITEDGGTYSGTATIDYRDYDLSDLHFLLLSSFDPTVTLSPSVPAGRVPSGGFSGLLEFSFSASQNNADLSDDFHTSFLYSVANASLQGLGAGETVTQVYHTLVSDSHGASAVQDVTVTLSGVEDAPTLVVGAGDSASATIAETDAGLSASGTLTARDPDWSDTLTVTVLSVTKGGNNTGGLVPSDAVLKAMLSVPATIAAEPEDASNLNWTFNSGGTTFDYLASTDHLDLTYTIQVDDGHGGTATRDVLVTINGSNDGPFVTGASGTTINITEDGGTYSGTASIDYRDYDLRDAHFLMISSFDATITLSPTVPAGRVPSGGFASGLIFGFSPPQNSSDLNDDFHTRFQYSVDNASLQGLGGGESVTEVYHSLVVDAHGGSATRDVTVVLNGVEDVPTITLGAGDSAAATLAETNAGLSASGTLTAGDPDWSDTLSVSIVSFAKSGTTTGLATSDAALMAMLSVPASLTADPEETSNLGWSFDSAGQAFDYLDDGESLTLTYSIQVDDGHGNTASRDVIVTITGTNDAPVISFGAGDVTNVAVLETDTTVTASGSATLIDPDLSDSTTLFYLSLFLSGTTAGLQSTVAALADDFTVPASLAADAGSAGNLGWSFNSGAEHFDYLDDGESMILTYSVGFNDDNAVLSNVADIAVVTINGANDAPLISLVTTDSVAATLAETNADLSTSGTLTVVDPDLSDAVTATVSGVVASGTITGIVPNAAALQAMMSVTGGSIAADRGATHNLGWSFNSGGEAFNYLDDGETLTVTYTITVTDDSNVTDTQDVVITITGTNDAPTISFGGSDITNVSVNETDTNVTASGSATLIDPDLSDSVTKGGSSLLLSGTLAGLQSSGSALLSDFTVPATLAADPGSSGNLTWGFDSGAENFNYLDDGESLVLKYSVGYSDDNGTSTSAQIAVVTINGTNDAPVISVGTGDSAGSTLAETNAGLASSGTLTVIDPDLSDAVTASVTGVVAGGTTIGIVPNNAALLAMLGVSGGTIAADLGDTHNLAWTFNSGGEVFNYLDDGETLTLTYTVQVADDNNVTDPQVVTITVTGTNDAPVISLVITDSVAATIAETNAALSAGGTYTVVDPDLSDSVSTSLVSVVASGTTAGLGSNNAALAGMLGLPGSVAADVGSTHNLAWTWNSTPEAFDYLGVGETLTLTYNTRVTDDSGATADQAITITINGSNDAPFIIPPTDAAGAVTELPDHDPNENIATHSDAGTLYFDDLDASDTHTRSVVEQGGGYLGTFTVGAVDQANDTIAWSFSISDAALNSLPHLAPNKQYYDVTIDDGHGGTIVQTVVIDLIGTNDAAVMTSANVILPQGPDSVSAAGDLDITDEDDPALFIAQTNQAGSYGHFSINAAGNWSYTADAAYILGPDQALGEVFTVLAQDGTPTTVSVTIQGIDQPGMARNDLFTTLESSVFGSGANLFNDNGNGPDTDPDSALVIGAVNGNPANVGHSLLLASGARVIVNSNGTFSYDTNGAWTHLSGLIGASNHFGHDSFTYGLVGGGSATVLMNIVGQVTPGDISYGSGVEDNIFGSSANDLIRLDQDGSDRATGEGGNDGFYFGSTLDHGDSIDGGSGNDTVALQGGVAVALGDITNVELLALLSGSNASLGDTANNRYDYDITTNNGNVAAGQTLTVIGTGLLPSEDLRFDGSAETDGNFRIFAGQGVDTLIGGSGNDGFFFGADGNLTGADHVDGGAGTDSIALRGNYAGANTVVFQDGSFSNVEVLAFLSGHTNEYGGVILPGGYDYDVTMSDGNVGGGRTFDVSASGLKADESFRFDGRAETDASFRIFSGAGEDTLYGSSQNDLIYGAMGKDWMQGGEGADIYVFRSAAESTSIGYDTISGFDWTADRIDAPGGTRSFSQSASGDLSLGSFDADLAARMSGVLGAGQAALFTASGGSLSGRVFAVIDANGVAGYQAGEDLVIELVSPVLPIDPTAWVLI